MGPRDDAVHAELDTPYVARATPKAENCSPGHHEVVEPPTSARFDPESSEKGTQTKTPYATTGPAEPTLTETHLECVLDPLNSRRERTDESSLNGRARLTRHTRRVRPGHEAGASPARPLLAQRERPRS